MPDITANGQPVKVNLLYLLGFFGAVVLFCGAFLLGADAEQRVKTEQLEKEVNKKIDCKLDKTEFDKYNLAYRQEYQSMADKIEKIQAQGIETDKKVVKILTILEEREKKNGK